MKSLLEKKLEMVIAQVMNDLQEIISLIPEVKAAVKTVMMSTNPFLSTEDQLQLVHPGSAKTLTLV